MPKQSEPATSRTSSAVVESRAAATPSIDERLTGVSPQAFGRQIESLLDDLHQLKRRSPPFDEGNASAGEAPNDDPLSDRIFVRGKSDNYVRLLIDDICWIKADGNYCDIVCANSKYVVCANLKQFEERLAIGQFLRVHRSYMVNLRRITEFGEFFIIINDETIPIGRSHKDDFARRVVRF